MWRNYVIKCGRIMHRIWSIIVGFLRHWKEYKKYDNNSVILIGIPEHGNLGDQAISYAEEQFIKKVLAARKLVMVPEDEFIYHFLCIKKFTDKNHNLCILHGGGNIGVLYKRQEKIRQLSVRFLRKAQIIVFPQSVDYQEEDYQSIKKARRIYEHHPDITFFLRESASYEKFTGFFPMCRAYLCPDIVLSLNIDMNLKTSDRKGILLCMRDDKEKSENNKNVIDEVKKLSRKMGKRIKVTDTVDSKYEQKYSEQISNLIEKWNLFASYEVIVTDRLHGMIFSVLTHTPCVGLDNSTGKVKSLYNTWLKQCEGIKFVSTTEELLDYLRNFEGYKTVNSEKESIDIGFKVLEECLFNKV